MNSFPRWRPSRGTRVCYSLFTTVHECTHTIPPSSPSYSDEAWIPGFLCRCPLFPRSCIIHHSFLFHAPFTSDGLQGLPFPVLSWPGKPFGWDEERDFHSPRGGGRGWTLAVPRRHSDPGSRGVPRFLGGVGMGSDPSQKGPQRSSPWIGGVSIHVPTGLFRVPSLSAVPSPRSGFPSVPRSKGEKPWGSSPLGSRHRTRIQRCVRRTCAHERAMATKGAHRAFHVWRRGRKQTESRRSDVEMARMDVAEGGA